MYRFLTGMKLQELRGWTGSGLLPARSSMLRAWAAFESTLREEELARVAAEADLVGDAVTTRGEGAAREPAQLKSPSAAARARAS